VGEDIASLAFTKTESEFKLLEFVVLASLDVGQRGAIGGAGGFSIVERDHGAVVLKKPKRNLLMCNFISLCILRTL
jgi:hypothetical protein